MRDFAMAEFCEFFDQVDTFIRYTPDELKSFLRRLQLLAYSQFWDSVSIQRVLFNLVNTCNGGQYDFEKYTKNRPSTFEIINEIKQRSRKANLGLGNFLETNYNNALRNAFVHSQYCFMEKYIWFLDFTKGSIPRLSLTLEEWEDIYFTTHSFISILLRRRIEELNRMRQLVPIRVDIPELRFKRIVLDSQGRWSVEN